MAETVKVAEDRSTCKAGDLISILGSVRSPGEENGYPLQHLAWRIPGTKELCGLQIVGSQSQPRMSY